MILEKNVQEYLLYNYYSGSFNVKIIVQGIVHLGPERRNNLRWLCHIYHPISNQWVCSINYYLRRKGDFVAQILLVITN